MATQIAPEKPNSAIDNIRTSFLYFRGYPGMINILFAFIQNYFA